MGNRDHILARFASNQDQRYAAWNAFVNFEMPDVDLFTPQPFCSQGPKIIVSTCADEDDVSAGTGRGHRLVGAFPTGGAMEVSTQECFSRFGEPLADDNQISIRTAEQKDPGESSRGHWRPALRLFRGIQRGAHLLIDLLEESGVTSQDLFGSIATLRQLSPFVAEP